MKHVTLAVLAVLMFLVVPFLAVADEISSTAVETTVSESQTSGASPQLVVYYFHGDRRCKTCNAIEANTKAVLDKRFAEQMKSGAVQWHVINTDKEENAHFEKDFQLLFGSVVAVRNHNGKQVAWKNLQKVWELVWDTDKFNTYLEKEFTEYLKSDA